MTSVSINIEIRLYEELNRVFDPGEKKRPFWKQFQSGTSLGQLIASIGLDQSEVDLALINSKPAGFWQVLRDEDRISLYPEFESFDIRDLALQESGPLRRTRLVAAPELSLLGGRLQEMGFDCKLIQDLSLDELIEIGKQEKRILLTRNPEIAALSDLDRCLCLHETRVGAQVREIIQRLQL